jgi:hypothetical protein
VVAGDVVELDSVLVEVVEDAQAPLVPLPVVRLRATSSAIIQPFLKGQFHKIIPNRKWGPLYILKLLNLAGLSL